MRRALAALVAAPLMVTAFGLPAHAEEPSTVSGYVFQDLNGDRQKQADEPGAAGFKVWVSFTSDGTGRTTYTDENGHFHFGDITQVGKFSIQFDPAGHGTTSPSAVGATLNNGGVNVTHDFGIK